MLPRAAAMFAEPHPDPSEAQASLREPCPPKTRADLEWDRVLDALAERCAYGVGRRVARALPFLGSREEVVRALAEVKEALDLDLAGEPLPFASMPEVEAGLERARIGAALSHEELRGVVAALEAGRGLRRFLHVRRERAPALAAACAMDPTLDAVERHLAHAFDPDGSLADRASPRLADLRAERRHGRDRLVRRLEDLVAKHADLLQDRFWTERDGRYVLPVRTDAHERLQGIVHATSASGATVFVEPRVVVELGNRQKMLDGHVAREEQAIYAALSERVGESVEGIAAVVRALAHADVRAAAAKLTKELDLAFPDVPPADAVTGGVLELSAARHPLLQLDGVDVVPSDLAIVGRRAMVVSGPNAGGKTVALKTLGLAALMIRAGLPVPGKHTSRVSVFDVVLSDVGDDQNLRKNLSTFSAHVQNLASILDAARPGALVLLDELAGGTDPREGEALAAAVLDSLCARGAAVACTTHYEGLKALALGDARFTNASVGFDFTSMTPTFRVAMGIPGASSALAVARRFGVPGTVIARAEGFLSRETVTFDRMVETLEAQRRALELAQAAADREAASLRDRRAELDRELERLAEKDRSAALREGEALLVALKRARDDLRLAQGRLREGRPTEEDLKAAARAIEAVARKTAIGGELELRRGDDDDARAPLAPGPIRLGARVYVPRVRAEGEVIEILERGAVRVAAGPLKLTVQVGELRSVTPSAPSRAKSDATRAPARAEAFDAAADPDVPVQTSDNTVDLRGLRADDAVSMAEQFLDRCLGAGRRVAFLIHGHGTGALRQAVRESLGTSTYVARSRAGRPGEGGDGVTVAWLKP